ncbi:MAG: CDP-alcohol phosphatidyltransferase family protein [Desulfobacteraceae bacterium]|nr:MAG: CDP-alcohol phosphatidyltransferase family protein [Desulfobacteraceae bacterium]
MFRTSAVHATYRRIAVQPAANVFLRLGVGPYLMSMIAAAAAVVASIVLAYDPSWGGVLIIVSGFLDTLDGQMARSSGNAGPAGAFLDSMLDRFSDCLFVFGLLVYYYRADALDFTGVLVFFWLSFGMLMGNYAQARAEGLNDTCSVGFWERPETLLFLGLSGILNGIVDWSAQSPFFRPGIVLGVALIVLAVGTNWMALRRLLYGFNRMRREPPADGAVAEIKK